MYHYMSKWKKRRMTVEYKMHKRCHAWKLLGAGYYFRKIKTKENVRLLFIFCPKS